MRIIYANVITESWLPAPRTHEMENKHKEHQQVSGYHTLTLGLHMYLHEI